MASSAGSVKPSIGYTSFMKSRIATNRCWPSKTSWRLVILFSITWIGGNANYTENAIDEFLVFRRDQTSPLRKLG